MAKNLPPGAIRFGCHVVAIHQDPGTHGTILTTAGGCTIRAKVYLIEFISFCLFSFSI
jgi:phytoene dehydrogenase-like protein